MKPETLRVMLAGGAAAFLALFFSCREMPSAGERALAAYPSDLVGSPDVRVALARRPEGVRVSVTGRFELIGGSGHRISHRNRSLRPVLVRGSGGALAVGDQRLGYGRIEFRPAPGEEVSVDGVAVPGGACFVREREGQGVAAVAVMDVEVYACAAVAASADWRRWSDQALAAHAVAARTLALYRRILARRAPSEWDFEDPGLAEVLRSGAHRSARVARAVNATRGLVLTWDRRLFPAFTTASCGGMTEDAANVFTTSSVTPLSGVRCPYCRRGRHPDAEWTVKRSTRSITERLRPYVEGPGLYRLGTVKGVEPASTGSSGRATRLRLRTAYGAIEIGTNLFRRALGEEGIPAAPLEVKAAGPEHVEFSGRGEGPGVGLCRRGAEEMAREGRSCAEILRFYFPGAELGRLPYRGRETAKAARTMP